MILTKPFDKNKLVEFNIATGDIFEVFTTDSTHQGVFEKINNDNIALYKKDGELILQINQSKWNLLDRNISLQYFHNFHEKKSFFSINEIGRASCRDR